MKKTKLFAVITVMLIAIAMLISCGPTEPDPTLWDSATYKEDATFGEGEKTVTVQVAVYENLVTFTIRTDADTVGAALMEHDLIAGDVETYGLYVKVVNGIRADYDVDQSYWAFYIDGEYAMAGVDLTEITEGAIYRLEYTK